MIVVGEKVFGLKGFPPSITTGSAAPRFVPVIAIRWPGRTGIGAVRDSRTDLSAEEEAGLPAALRYSMARPEPPRSGADDPAGEEQG
jgi:hypothetical protein